MADQEDSLERLNMETHDSVESMTIEKAMAEIVKYPRVEGTENLPIADCIGRVLAEDVVALDAVPTYASSAMDGYAFCYSDAKSGKRLQLQGRVPAGYPLSEPLAPERAVRIFTGGMMPVGADTVAMQEDCLADDLSVQLPTTLSVGANCRPAGDDIEQGSRVLVSGTRLRPQDIGLAASVNRAVLSVHRRLKVGLATTGDELRAPGDTLPPGCIRDSNRHAIGAALRALGAEVTDYGIVPDNRMQIRNILARAAAENDIVFSTGGVSVGDEDHVRPAVQEIGSLMFWRLPIKPGRPVAVGQIEGTPFVGLPGNPVSVMIAFWLIGRPLLLHLSGASNLHAARFPVTAAFGHKRNPGRREFLRGRLYLDDAGAACVTAYRSSSSGMLSSLTWSEGLIEISEDQGDIHQGDRVQFVPYTGLTS